MEWIVNLQSFVVEAESEKEAYNKAIKMIQSGAETIYIDYVEEG